MFLCERWCAVSREDIAGIVAFKYGMIIFTSFVICRVGASTQCAFGWGIAWFCAGSAVAMTAAFYAGIWLVTVFLRMSVLLTPCTLRNVVLGCARRFKVNNLILDGSRAVDILVVLSRFEVCRIGLTVLLFACVCR